MKLLISLTAFTALVFSLNSCSKKNETTLNSLSPLVNANYTISLEKPVSLDNKKEYNLHWDSNLPEHKVSYNLSVNGKLVKRNLTKTVISEQGSVIEFNVPVNDYSIPTEVLKQGSNTIQVIAEFNGAEVHQSNKVEIVHDQRNFLAGRYEEE